MSSPKQSDQQFNSGNYKPLVVPNTQKVSLTKFQSNVSQHNSKNPRSSLLNWNNAYGDNPIQPKNGTNAEPHHAADDASPFLGQRGPASQSLQSFIKQNQVQNQLQQHQSALVNQSMVGPHNKRLQSSQPHLAQAK